MKPIKFIDRFDGMISWQTLRHLGELRIMKFMVLAPFLPFVIVLTDGICQSLAGFPNIANVVREAIPVLTIASFYYGLNGLGMASLIYYLRCPPLIRRYKSHVDYRDAEVVFDSTHFRNSIANRIRVWRNNGVIVDEDGFLDTSVDTLLASDLMRMEYDVINIVRRNSRCLCCMCYCMGLLLVFLPALMKFIWITVYLTELLWGK